MKINFKLNERIAGFSAEAAKAGEKVTVICSESLTSLDDGHLTWRLEEIHKIVFSKVPELPDPSHINSILVVIHQDLSAVAYVNEISPIVTIKPARKLSKGELVFGSDILDVLTFEIGIEVPKSCALIFFYAQGWRRALFYDLYPLNSKKDGKRAELSKILAEQSLEMIHGKFADIINDKTIDSSIKELEKLLKSNDNNESKYQELLIDNPWLLGGLHSNIERHMKLDDQNVPDFTGVRASDGFRDIFEVKPPFMNCFRRDGGYSAEFNDAWAQAERYLSFAREQRQYLRDKGLGFENPRCYLLLGYNLTEDQRKALRTKEKLNPSIIIFTYREVIAVAKSFMQKMKIISNLQ